MRISEDRSGYPGQNLSKICKSPIFIIKFTIYSFIYYSKVILFFKLKHL